MFMKGKSGFSEGEVLEESLKVIDLKNTHLTLVLQQDF